MHLQSNAASHLSALLLLGLSPKKKKKKKENKMKERFLYSEIRVEHPLSKYSNILNYKHTKGPSNSYLHK